MSGTKGHSGGDRPNAPQNNPANVSATGGAGQNGQAKTYIPGLPQGQGQATMEQQSGAPMFQASAQQTAFTPDVSVTPITEPSQRPDEHIMTGAPVGPGAGPEALIMPKQPSEDPDIQMIRDYLPIMEYWAQQAETPQSTKDYVQYLKTIV
jgi:hypothetical protein